MRYGTSHFVSIADARNYYAEGHYAHMNSEQRQAMACLVADKLKAGEIHIGTPKLKEGERATVIPGEGRYQIETTND